MIFEKPRMEILRFETKDVVCASVGGNHDIDDPYDSSDQDGMDW